MKSLLSCPVPETRSHNPPSIAGMKSAVATQTNGGRIRLLYCFPASSALPQAIAMIDDRRVLPLLGGPHLPQQHRVDPKALRLTAQRTRNVPGQPDQQETKRLPIVVVEATVSLDLFWG